MNVVRSLWASIQGDPKFMRAVNGWLTIVWIMMIPISLVTRWISSVTYVAALSLWAPRVGTLVVIRLGLSGTAEFYEMDLTPSTARRGRDM